MPKSVQEVSRCRLQPYPPQQGPIFELSTYYAGVYLGAGGQSGIKLGYRLSMDQRPVIETRRGHEDFYAAADRDFASTSTLLQLLATLTSPFHIESLIERELLRGRKGAKRVERLLAYKPHADALWSVASARWS